jgi:hypothetical protein
MSKVHSQLDSQMPSCFEAGSAGIPAETSSLSAEASHRIAEIIFYRCAFTPLHRIAYGLQVLLLFSICRKCLELEDVVVVVTQFTQGTLDLALLHAILGSTNSGVLTGRSTNEELDEKARESDTSELTLSQAAILNPPWCP